MILSVPAANRTGTFARRHTLGLPSGWRAEVWARVRNARLEQWTPQGNLLVSDPTDGKIVELMPHSDRGKPPAQRVVLAGLDKPQGMAFDRLGGQEVLYVAETDQIDRYRWRGDRVGVRTVLVSDPTDGKIVELMPRSDRAKPPAQRVVLAGLDKPQGMAFDRLGGQEVLYVAETDQIDRYRWRDDRVGVRTVLIRDLPSGSDHRLKNIVVGPHHDLFFDIGSTANASPSPRSNPPFATVMQYTAAGRRLRVWARGVRNGDGLAFAPDGSLWSAINERDNIAYPFHRAYRGHADAYGRVIQAYVNNHPADEIAKLSGGRNLGWPYCNPDPDAHPGSETTSFRYSMLRFDPDPQTNPGDRILDCSKLAPLNVGLPAHSAPLGFHFLEHSKLPSTWRSGALVAVHGSWNRKPPRAPAVLWMPWKPRGRTLGTARHLVTGFQYPNGARWGRPVDAVAGPDGALYVSDNTAGAIYRIVP